MGKAESGTGTAFAYDDEGRVTDTRKRNILFDQTTSTLYNYRCLMRLGNCVHVALLPPWMNRETQHGLACRLYAERI